MRRRPLIISAIGVAVIAIAASAAVASGVMSGPTSGQPASRDGAGGGTSGSLPSMPVAPKLAGTVVNVSLTDLGGSVGQGNGQYSGSAMGLSTDHTTVRHGTVSFYVTNAGNVNHEMVILPLDDSHVVGDRPFGPDARIDEAGTLGEASNSGGRGEGEKIVPGASSWVTVNMEPGRYELVCNLTGHYASGMYAGLTVS